MSKSVKPKGKYTVVFKYIAILLTSGLFGAAVSMGVSMFSENLGMIGDSIEALICDIIIPVQWLVFLLLAIASIILYMNGLRYVKKVEADRDDEAASEKADSIIGLGLTLASANMILTYWLFGVQVTLPNPKFIILSGVTVIILLLVYYSIYMSKAIRLIKRINPEKRGDPLDLKFQKDWENSADEGEKMAIYQASFFSYKLTNSVILALWLVTVVASMFFDVGGYTVTVITIIWLAHTIGYQCKCLALKKKKLN